MHVFWVVTHLPLRSAWFRNNWFTTFFAKMDLWKHTSSMCPDRKIGNSSVFKKCDLVLHNLRQICYYPQKHRNRATLRTAYVNNNYLRLIKRTTKRKIGPRWEGIHRGHPPLSQQHKSSEGSRRWLHECRQKYGTALIDRIEVAIHEKRSRIWKLSGTCRPDRPRWVVSEIRSTQNRKCKLLLSTFQEFWIFITLGECLTICVSRSSPETQIVVLSSSLRSEKSFLKLIRKSKTIYRKIAGGCEIVTDFFYNSYWPKFAKLTFAKVCRYIHTTHALSKVRLRNMKSRFESLPIVRLNVLDVDSNLLKTLDCGTLHITEYGSSSAITLWIHTHWVKYSQSKNGNSHWS